MLYYVRQNGQLNTTTTPKLDSSNNCRHVLTMPTNDANTKMVYAENKTDYMYFSPSSPADSTAGRWTNIIQNADDLHRTLNPGGLWRVAGSYTYPSHPGWLVAREGVLYIDDNYTIQQMSVDSSYLSAGSTANPGLYSGNYWLFNSGSSWDAGQSNRIAAWCMNGGGGLVNTPIYNVGYGQSFIGPAGTPTAPAFTSQGMSGFRNAMAWRLLWLPSWSDTRACRSYAQENITVTRTNTDGSQFVASDHYNGGYSGDLNGTSVLTTVLQMS